MWLHPSMAAKQGALLTTLTFLLFGPNTAFKQEGTCLFPERWEGTWFQSGVRQPIIIEGPRLSNKGRCLDASNEMDKFLVVDDKRICYRCVVIHQKHINVLQYKETFCHGRESLPNLCSLITGDALLYSMFREGALPVPCPFRAPFTFTYNRGHGECRSPVSSIDACTEESRLLLSYQACPDVYGSESAVEELQCLATWKEGSSRYLVGQVHHGHATSNEDRFRCFVYEKVSSSNQQLQQGVEAIDYRVAQSGDATCNGLASATEGSRTMTLKKVPSGNHCRFPGWLATSPHWHTLDYSTTYSFHHRNSTLRISNTSGFEMKVICARPVPYATGNHYDTTAMLAAHFTTGCQSGYMCMLFHRRDNHVVEVQTGTQVRRPEDACIPMHFNRSELPYTTLVTTSPEPRSCPHPGKFAIINGDEVVTVTAGRRRRRRRGKRDLDTIPCESPVLSGLVIGCGSPDTMEFHSDCPAADIVSTYSCHGRWEENGTYYLITTPLSRASHGARRSCFAYREIVPGRLQFSSSTDSCDRNIKPSVNGRLIFNASSVGKCVETGSSSHTSGALFVLLLPVATALCVNR